MNQAIRKLSGLLVLPVLLAALLLLPVRANAVEYACTAELPVSVTLNGNNAEKFHITIECAEDADPTQPMPVEAEEGLWVTGGETASFTNFAYTRPGDYKYVIRQENRNTQYMTYDDTVYTVVIRVTNKETEEGTTLQYEVYATTEENTEDKAQAISFLNTYAPPTPTPKPDDHPDIAEAIANGTWGTPTPKPTSWIPQTSDSLPLVSLIVVLVVAAVAIVALVVARKRSKKDEGTQE